MTSSGENDLEALVRIVAASSGYRSLDRDLIAAVGARELGKRRTLKEAVKATKSKLHQVAGAYFPRQDYSGWLKALEQAATTRNPEAMKAACRAILAQHSSTRERLPILDEFYARALASLPPPRRVLDIACGLNPLTTPWMPLAPNAEYVVYDVYPELAAFLETALPLLGLRGMARVADVTVASPTEHADLVLLLKALPCLEQLDIASGARLLDAVHTDHLLVSFPVRSLSGRGKGMMATYDAQMKRLLAGKPWAVARFEFATELVFLVSK